MEALMYTAPCQPPEWDKDEKNFPFCQRMLFVLILNRYLVSTEVIVLLCVYPICSYKLM